MKVTRLILEATIEPRQAETSFLRDQLTHHRDKVSVICFQEQDTGACHLMYINHTTKYFLILILMRSLSIHFLSASYVRGVVSHTRNPIHDKTTVPFAKSSWHREREKVSGKS